MKGCAMEIGKWGVITICLGIGYIIYGVHHNVLAMVLTGLIVIGIIVISTIKARRK